MKYFVGALSLIILLGCRNMSPEIGYTSELIEQYFTLSDRVEIAKIISFVDSVVLKKCENEDISDVYHSYLDSLFMLRYDYWNWDPMVIDQDIKYNFLF